MTSGAPNGPYCKASLQGFAVLRNVESFELVLARYAQRHEQADQLEQKEAHARGPDEGDGDPVELDQQLLRMALDQARGAADRAGREYAGEQRAGQPADAGDAEHVKPVGVIQAVL